MVLDPPMLPQHLSILARPHPAAADKVVHLGADFGRHGTLAIAHAHGGRLGPCLPIAQSVDMMDDHIRAFLLPAVALGRRRVLLDDPGVQLAVQRLCGRRLDIFQQVPLVAFHGPDVVATARYDLLSDLLLAAHGINGRPGPVQVQQLQQQRNGRDFVGLLVHGHLPQRQLRLGGPRTDQVQQPHLGTGRAAQRLAIDGNVADADQVGPGAEPGETAALKRLAVQGREPTFKGIVARNAPGQLQKAAKPRLAFLGESGPAMQKIVQLIEKVARADATVLIRGESGTGKELVARALHHNSPRRGRPLVTVNCAALQENLLESELFGHEKGAFTGAVQAKPGLVEAAEGGTLFIDEVAEMTPALQAKLLRVLEDGHYRRVGGTRECQANVRVIAATNKPLEEEQKAGRFREDLFYRLNVVSIDLSPLRERREDIPALVEHFLTTRQLGKVRYQVQPDAMQALLTYSWPGNVRELANVLERAQILAEDHCITLDDLPEAMQAAPAVFYDSSPLNLSQLERQTIHAALQQAKGNKVHAAKLLGISRRALYRLITKYGLEESEG